MSPSKKRTTTRTRSRRRRNAPPPRALVAALIAVLVAGVAAVKYFQSPRGTAALLDAGFFGYYAQVQEHVGAALLRGLPGEGISETEMTGWAGGRGARPQGEAQGPNIVETVGFSRAGDNVVRYLQWEIDCSTDADFIRINVALTRAVQKAGGRVRRSHETDDGGVLFFDVGTRRFDTHRLILRKRVVGRTERAPNPRPRLAIVIDDFGYTRGGAAADLLSMRLPLTVSVLPDLPYSGWALEHARREGKCVLLHLPMEPGARKPSDLEMVRVDMSDREIAALVERYLLAMPGAEGVNNHQGSYATADGRVMRTVLGVVGRHDLFFLDSLTSAESVAYDTARALGVPAARNALFIDADTEDPAVVAGRVGRLISMARRNGTAIGIGHPRAWTREGLKRGIDRLKDSGVDLVPLSELVH